MLRDTSAIISEACARVSVVAMPDAYGSDHPTSSWTVSRAANLPAMHFHVASYRQRLSCHHLHAEGLYKLLREELPGSLVRRKRSAGTRECVSLGIVSNPTLVATTTTTTTKGQRQTSKCTGLCPLVTIVRFGSVRHCHYCCCCSLPLHYHSP